MGKNNNRRRSSGENAGGGNNAQNAQGGKTNNAKPQAGGTNAGGSNNGGNKNRFYAGGNNKNRQKPRAQGGAQAKGKAANDENRKDTYVYELDGNVYINLTNKCSNGCEFCVRNERASYYGNYLWLRHGEPTAEKVIAALSAKDLSA
ncbi:MAG: hypothetical protein ACI4RO_03220, partial [Candidatus Scatosoma sp.]